MTFSEFTTRWERTILPLKKPATRDTFKGHLRELREAFGQGSVALSYHDLQSFFTSKAAENSPRTVQNLWSTLNVVLNQAKREGLISEIPRPVLPKIRRVSQSWLTVDQMRTIIRSSEGQYQSLFAILSETGLRIGEALGLQCYDLGDKTITVRRSVYAGKTQDPKTESSVRTICVSARLDSLLRGMCTDNPKEFIFRTTKGTCFRPNDVLTRGLHRVMRDLGMPRCGFHAFRRGAITHWAKIGVPEKIAAVRAGHVIQGLTFGLYAQIVPLADRDWAEKIAEGLYE